MSNRGIVGSFVFGAGLLGLCLTGCSAEPDHAEAVSSVSEAATTESAGFVMIEGLSGSFNALSAFSMNTTGGTNSVTWLGAGQARVDFPGIGNEFGGNVQVTTFAFEGRCKVQSWTSSGTTLQVFVRCHNTAGTLTSLPFTASYVRRAGAPGVEGGYVWADQPSTASYTPSLTYQWNSTGSNATIQRTGTGAYTVVFPGQNFTGGTVEVTAYGTGSEYCKVQNWFPSGGNQNVNVRCFTSAGAAVDSLFTAKFTREAPNKTGTFAFAWANDPFAASYTPSLTYQKAILASECGPQTRGPVTIARTATGRYTVTFAGIPGNSSWPSHVKVTAYGSGSETCRINSWSGGFSNTTANVACSTAAGSAVDTLYTISLSSTIFLIC